MSMLVTAAGNLVTDPILRFSQAGKAVCSFRIACDSGKDKPTVFKDCTAFGSAAENLGASCLKGDRVIVKGRMESQEWTSKEGKAMSKDVIIAEDVGPSLLFAEMQIGRKSRDEYTGQQGRGSNTPDDNIIDDNMFN